MQFKMKINAAAAKLLMVMMLILYSLYFVFNKHLYYVPLANYMYNFESNGSLNGCSNMNASLLIGVIGSKKSECFTFIDSLIHIGLFTGRIYIITDANPTTILTNLSQQYNSLYSNNSLIISINSSKINQSTFEHLKSIIYNSKLMPNDVLLWYDCDTVVTSTNCIYDSGINIGIGSNQWLSYKAMESPQWKDYRLGDMYRWRMKRRQPGGYKFHKANFPDSIAVLYMDEMGQKRGADINILLNVLRGKKQIYPPDDALVMHLRIGDVFHKPWLDKDRCKILYDPISVLKEEILPSIYSLPISQVILIGGFHSSKVVNHTESINYIINIQKWFEKYKYSVYLRINEQPDEDFIFMSNSKYLVQNIRGFSKVIAQIVKKKNGTVFTIQDASDRCWDRKDFDGKSIGNSSESIAA